MNTGYSLLLGEYIDADAIEYRDCEPFQIVCPNCKEPIFKATRSGEKDVIHYLSHYRKKGSYEADCILRVSAISAPDRQVRNTQSRDQKLSYFLKVFLDALERDPVMSYGKSLAATHKKINQSKAWRLFREQHFESGRKGGIAQESEFRESAAFYLKDISEIGGVPVTGFSTETQIRIATDIMKYLTSNPGRPNYYALYNHAAVYLIQRCQNSKPGTSAEGIEVMENVSYFLTGLIRTGKKAGLQIIADMNASPIYPPYVSSPSTYVLKVASEIGHEMIGTLLRLPYFELLKSQQK